MYLNFGSKKAMTLQEIAELVVAALGIFIIGTLMFLLIRPQFDNCSKTADNFLGDFEEVIKRVDSGKKGEFEIWESPEGCDMFLVYFGKRDVIDGFVNPGSVNDVCICYDGDGEKRCSDSLLLKYPVDYYGMDYFVIDAKENVSVRLENETYLVTGGVLLEYSLWKKIVDGDIESDFIPSKSEEGFYRNNEVYVEVKHNCDEIKIYKKQTVSYTEIGELGPHAPEEFELKKEGERQQILNEGDIGRKKFKIECINDGDVAKTREFEFDVVYSEEELV